VIIKKEKLLEYNKKEKNMRYKVNLFFKKPMWL
jgi:hypothetical protein